MIATITVWLLVSLGVSSSGYREAPAHNPTVTVERFATVQECERVMNAITSSLRPGRSSPLRCIEATVVKP